METYNAVTGVSTTWDATSTQINNTAIVINTVPIKLLHEVATAKIRGTYKVYEVPFVSSGETSGGGSTSGLQFWS